MKMNNKIKQLLHISLLFSVLVFFASCENLFEQKTSETTQVSTEEKTYLIINCKTGNSGRTVYPDYVSSVQDLSNFKLSGFYEGELEPSLIYSKSTYDSFIEVSGMEITAGNWSFTLEAKDESNNISYTDSISRKIIRGSSNNISFVLKPSGDASISITISLAANTGVDTVVATLKKLNDETVDSKDFDISGKTGDERNVTYSNTSVTPGNYKILFEFFTGTTPTTETYNHRGNDPTPINQWESYLKVVPGLTTSDTISLNFNSVYTITYAEPNEDGYNTLPIANLTSENTAYTGIAITKYSARSNFDLPICPDKEGKVFLGWKNTEGNVITKITPGTTGDLVLVCNYVDPVLYVSGVGNESNLGFTETSPLKSVDKACEKIISYGRPELDWTIKVNGEITGIPKGKNGVNQTHGHSEIPAEITTEKAKSILITGATTHSDWLTGDVPSDLDTINRGSNGAYNSTLDSSSQGISGSALVISSSVPVTITNLKITGGNTSGSGAGILINENATVSIGDGVLITGNRASNKGGAICNKGTLYIYGSAIIGDKTDRSNYNPDDTTTVNRKYPSYSSTQNLADGGAANYAANGGGIYNGDPNASTVANTSLVAKLYLGYKPGTNSPQEETFTGGIYFCGASSGGAISNAIKSEIYMASGNLKFNGVLSDGGAIKNDDAGRIEMSGGEISHNSASYTGSVIRGGGICNLYNRSTFIMSGGKIINNRAWCTASGTNGKGGGVFNGGYMFMYGSAVIGEVPSTLPTPDTATSDSYSNKANLGGGIYNSGESGDYYGRIYIGYEPGGENGKTPVEAELSGGVYYNYSKAVHSVDSTWGGGGIYCGANNGYGEFKMASGEVAYNATNDNGGGLFGQIVTLSTEDHNISIHDNTSEKQGDSIYIVASSYNKLILGGNLDIPDICMGVDSNTHYSTIQIASALDASFNPIITPTSYLANIQLIKLTTEYQNSLGSSAAEQLAAECNKFTITPQVSGTETTRWSIDGNGKLFAAPPDITPAVVVQNAANINFTFTCNKSTIIRDTETVVTITPDVKFNTTQLYYSEGKVYTSETTHDATTLISDESVSWDITLWDEDEQITNPDQNTHYVTTSGNTITLNIPYPETFKIKVNATYLGYTHDAEFPITCE